jgi:hypothetical protein
MNTAQNHVLSIVWPLSGKHRLLSAGLALKSVRYPTRFPHYQSSAVKAASNSNIAVGVLEKQAIVSGLVLT